MRTPPLLADFIHHRVCKPICEKLLTLPVDLKRLELSTSRMRTERSPKRAGFSDDQYPKKVWSLLKPARFL